MKTGATSLLLTLNPTANNYGGIWFKYGGTSKGMSVYNSGSMVYGGESGVGTILQTNGSHALNIDTSQNATFAGNITFGDSHTIGDDGDDNLVIASSASENIIIDSADDIVLDAAGNDVLFKYLIKLHSDFLKDMNDFLSPF